MLKAAAVLAVPGVMGGMGLLYMPGETSRPWSLSERNYAIEVGVAFEEAVVRDALPEGLDPAPGFTGGLAVYGGTEGRALSPMSVGHVWIDVVEERSGSPARYLVTGSDGASTIPLEVAALGETHELDGFGILRIQAWPDRQSTLSLVLRTEPSDCSDRITRDPRDPMISGVEGRLGVIPVPSALGWCEVEAEVLHANVSAPPSHVLRPFVPQQVLWARLASPSGESGAELLTQ